MFVRFSREFWVIESWKNAGLVRFLTVRFTELFINRGRQLDYFVKLDNVERVILSHSCIMCCGMDDVLWYG